MFEKTCHCRTVKPKGTKTKKERVAVDRNMARIVSEPLSMYRVFQGPAAVKQKVAFTNKRYV